MPNENPHDLEEHLADFSRRLSARSNEFAERCQFSETAKDTGRQKDIGHHGSTGEVLWERFSELLAISTQDSEIFDPRTLGFRI